jgi:hypothetical protein
VQGIAARDCPGEVQDTTANQRLDMSEVDKIRTELGKKKLAIQGPANMTFLDASGPKETIADLNLLAFSRRFKKSLRFCYVVFNV